jgi:polyphenol oxidase
MDLPEPFREQRDHIAIDLRDGGAHVLYTTRRGGVSQAPFDTLNLGRTTPEGDEDDPAAVGANRDLLGVEVDKPRRVFALGRQVHGARVRRVVDPIDPTVPPEEADGQATAHRGLVLTILAADCLPIAIAGRETVAMLHGGWRPLAAGIVTEGVTAMRELGEEGPIEAAIGPGIGPCCFEVGDEVREAFARQAATSTRLVSPLGNVDLKLVARLELEAAGVKRIHDVGLCTSCEAELFFSHRRDGGRTGRQAGVVWRD